MSSTIYFSTFPVTKQVFFKSKFSFLLVNIKPLVPGHVLIVPFRVVPKLKDLTPAESQDFFETLQKIHRFIEKTYKADSLNIAIQDGKLLGQSVPHLHVHIIPRYFTDGEGDGIYDKLEENELTLKDQFKRHTNFHVDDSERKPRSDLVMQLEAEWLILELQKYEDEHEQTSSQKS